MQLLDLTFKVVESKMELTYLNTNCIQEQHKWPGKNDNDDVNLIPDQGWAILSLVYRISYSRIIWQISYIGDIKAISWYFIRYFWSNSPITLESWGNKTKQTVLEFLTPTNKFKKK